MKQMLQSQQHLSVDAQETICSIEIKARWSKRGRRLLSLQVVIGCFAYFISTAMCQTTFGSVVGSVTDSSGAALAGASVTLTSVGTNEARKMTANASGVYSFADLQPGTYKVDVDDPGFKHVTINDIGVLTGGTTRANAVLQVGGQSERAK